jgi:hypothetical protein
MIRTQLARAKKYILKLAYSSYDKLMGTEKYTTFKLFQSGYHNPDYRFEKDQIALIHIPKTAGTSMAKLLSNDPENRFVLLDIHKPVSPHCLPTEYRYVTILRDPIARVWSHYQMVLRYPEGYPYRKYAVQGLEIFLKKTWETRNMMCRYLAGNTEQEPDNQTFEKAKANLIHFYKIIFFENFAKETTEFLTQHNIPFEKIPNERKSKYSQPTEAERTLIQQYNQWDLQLFQLQKSTTNS